MKKLFKRIEKKYRLTQSQFNFLYPKLLEKMEFDKYCINNQAYTIHNLYFDNHSDDIIIHSLSKPKFKEKVRVRSYKEIQHKNDDVFVEIKKKYDSVVYKRREMIKYDDLDKITKYDSQVSKEIQYLIRSFNLYPKVYIAYDRIALLGKDDSDFRVTFDFNIRSRRSNLSLKDCDDNNDVIQQNEYIMEIKVNQSMELWLSKLLSQLQIYPCSFSKYGQEYRQYRKEEKQYEIR